MSNMRTSDRAVASARHTTVLLLALLSISIWGAVHSPITEWPASLARPNARLFLYVEVALLQLLWVAYVWLGLRHSKTSLCSLIDEAKWTAFRWLKYLGLGVAGGMVYLAIGAGLSMVVHAKPEELLGVQAMLPQSPVEKTLWVAFAVVTGVCEEVVYRGYLLRQFGVLTGSQIVAVGLQALCYGLVHLILPAQMLAGVLVLGLLLGALAVWQKSLVPGMILHVGVSLLAVIQPS